MDVAMTILSALRRRSTAASAPATSDDSSAATSNGVAAEAPFDGYDRLSETELKNSLSKHSQVELAAMEEYELAHARRIAVLDKLRYMRGREPLEGYDAMSEDEVVAAIGEADLTTIKRIRGYERKFANRPRVSDEIIRVHHLMLEDQPVPLAPGLQAAKDAAAASAKASAAGAAR